MTNKNDKLVISYFTNAAAAEAAAEALKGWDKANDDIKLGAIGIITLNRENGEIEVNEIGQRNTKKGALWGTAIGAGLGILTLGIGLIPGVIAGAAIGGGIGALDHKSLGMSDEDRDALAEHLKKGGAALGVMCDDFEVEETSARLAEEGGKTADFLLQAEAATAVEVYAAAQKAASDAVDEAVDEVSDTVEAAKRAVGVELPDLDESAANAVGAISAALGVSAARANKLYEAGVDKASSLLQQGATPEGRKALAEASDLSEEEVMAAVKRMDLMRVKGVGVVYANLLHLSGVETVPDLARRNAANLAAKMAEVNESEHVSEVVPGEDEVAGWVDQAKDLPRVITY